MLTELEMLGKESLRFLQTSTQAKTDNRSFCKASVGEHGCSYSSESCLEKFSYIMYDVLAQILEFIPSIVLRLPNRGVLLTWEDAGQSLL